MIDTHPNIWLFAALLWQTRYPACMYSTAYDEYSFRGCRKWQSHMLSYTCIFSGSRCSHQSPAVSVNNATILHHQQTQESNCRRTPPPPSLTKPCMRAQKYLSSKLRSCLTEFRAITQSSPSNHPLHPNPSTNEDHMESSASRSGKCLFQTHKLKAKKLPKAETNIGFWGLTRFFENRVTILAEWFVGAAKSAKETDLICHGNREKRET